VCAVVAPSAGALALLQSKANSLARNSCSEPAPGMAKNTTTQE